MSLVGDSSAGGAAGVWAEIESPASQPRRDRVGGVGGGATGASLPAFVLRRHDRPVLGPFDAGCGILQRHARQAILGTAVFLVPALVLDLVVARLVFDRFTDLDEVVVAVPAFVGGAHAATGVETAMAVVSIVAGSLAVALAGGYLAQLVVHLSAGRPVTVRGVLAAMRRRLPALAAAWALGHAWIVPVGLVLVEVSASDLAPFAVLGAPVAAWLVGLTVLVSPALVAEQLGPLAGLRRAVRLARARFGTVFGFVVLCVVVGGGLRLMVGVLPQLVEATGLVSFGGLRGDLEGIAAQIAQLVVVPMVGLATARLYLQQRMDCEGMDLVVEAGAAFR